MSKVKFYDPGFEHPEFKEIVGFDLQLFADDSSGEKTEEPTERKIQQSREEGRVYKSQDIIVAFSLLAAFYSLKSFSSLAMRNYIEFVRKLYAGYISNSHISEDGFLILNESWFFFSKIMLGFGGILYLVAIASNLGQVGFLFSFKSMKFNFEKLNVFKGIKNLISKKSLFELFKFMIKFLFILWIMYMFLKLNISDLLRLGLVPLDNSLAIGFEKIYYLFIYITAFLLLFSALDRFVGKKMFMKDLRMTKHEIKREFKDIEGDPLLKGKLKEKQRDMTMNAVLKETKESTVVLANPTHVTVSLLYEDGMVAPVIKAMARDNIAQKVKEIAREEGIPVIENKPLARGIYNEGEIGAYVPDQYLGAVAEVIAFVMMSSRR